MAWISVAISGAVCAINPMPVALIGVGLGWLMVSGSRRANGGGRTDRQA